MCGIAGVFRPTRSNERIESELVGMAQSIAHRGPDSEGIWFDQYRTLGLAHRRLSIQDISPLGNQPMHSRSDRYVTAFNGEVYNFRQLRAELIDRGDSFRGNSDTEIVLAAIERWGFEESLERFEGMFALAVWDKRDRQLLLARDRMGEKPLYYGWQGDTFVFGSELKVLRRCHDWIGELDRDVVPLYLRFNYVPTPFSIYKNIYKLPAGKFLKVSSDSQQDKPSYYWSVNRVFAEGTNNPLLISPEDVVAELDSLLRASIAQQMISDVPLGAFLSGGVDSSTVVALMQATSSTKTKTFTIGFDVEGFDEAVDAKKVSHHLGTDHTELYVSPAEAMRVIPGLGEMYDEPFADSSQIPTYLVSRLTRKHVTVSLSGDGGDELFCGYDRYSDIADHWSRIRGLPYLFRRTAGAIGRRIPNLIATPLLYPVAKRISTGEPVNLGPRIRKKFAGWQIEDLAKFYRHSLSLWSHPNRVVLGAKERDAPFGDPDEQPIATDAKRRLRCIDAATYLADDILVKVDRAAMAVGLETRVPLLNHRVVEFASRIPTSVLMKDGRGKWPLRQILYQHVPRELVDRPKRGFEIPLSLWLKGSLRPWAEDLLDPRRIESEGIFNVRPIQREWRAFLAGGDYSSHHRLWGILMFQSWLDTIGRDQPGSDQSGRSFDRASCCQS